MIDARKMSHSARLNLARALDAENLKYGATLEPVEFPPDVPRPAGLRRAWRSRRFLVQEFDVMLDRRPLAGHVRLTVNRAAIDAHTGEWLAGIGRDDLQAIKAEAGYGDREAVEVYPPDRRVVNVANLRHLWILPSGARVPFSW